MHKKSNSKRPNLFDFARSELSQEAFLCWLLSWAHNCCKSTDTTLHQVGRGFLESIGDKFGEDWQSVTSGFEVEVKKQYRGYIDILILITIGEKKYGLIIEHKTDSATNNPLNYYREIVEKDFPNHETLTLFLQTHEIQESTKVQEAGYKIYSRKDFLEVLGTYDYDGDCIDSIIRDYHEYLDEIDRCYSRWHSEPFSDWEDYWNVWIGFFGALQREMRQQYGLKTEWGHANAPDGGELVFYPKENFTTKYGHLYWEIHKKGRHFLAFKVSGMPEELNSLETLYTLCDELKTFSNDGEWRNVLVKPKKFASKGNTKVFCETIHQDSWLKKDVQGKVDITETAKRLNRAHEWLRQFAEFINYQKRKD